MSKEVYGNAGNSFLASSITATDVTLTVSGGTWPTGGQFTIYIDGEYLLVTAMTGTGPYTFTVTRGQEGTTAAIHNQGTLVFVDLTDGSLRRLSIQSINGTIVSSRRQLNFVSGNVSLTDDATNDKVDVTIGIAIVATLPSSPFAGQQVFLTSDNTMNIYTGSAWKKSPAYT